jgi:hypothetical protein
LRGFFAYRLPKKTVLRHKDLVNLADPIIRNAVILAATDTYMRLGLPIDGAHMMCCLNFSLARECRIKMTLAEAGVTLQQEKLFLSIVLAAPHTRQIFQTTLREADFKTTNCPDFFQ